MNRPARVFLGFVIFLFILAALPLNAALSTKNSLNSALKTPILVFRTAVNFLQDLYYFRRNAEENKRLKKKLAEVYLDEFRTEELYQENLRLTKLLELENVVAGKVTRTVYARVIGRSPASWNSVFLVDKGTRDGIHPNMLVMSDASLVGKIIEAGPSVSKVLMITDPNSKIGVLIQRTRQQGVLFGTASGQCRVKYLSLDRVLERGDTVETAGFGGFFPKGLIVGTIDHAWKEPGQMYQVAVVKPLADLSRIEEVACVD